jgi:hypothetical protein
MYAARLSRQVYHRSTMFLPRNATAGGLLPLLVGRQARSDGEERQKDLEEHAERRLQAARRRSQAAWDGTR